MNEHAQPPRRQGAVAVICRGQQLLVIRRSELVEAPGTYCFPGGAIEEGESPSDTVRRELREELGVDAQPVRQLWQSVTPWNVELSWWLAELEPSALLQLNPLEVAEVQWLTPAEMRDLPALLESNRHFLDAWQQGAFRLGDLEP